jgi:transposase
VSRSRPQCWQCEALGVENTKLLDQNERLLRENERLVRENTAARHEIARLRHSLGEAQRAAKRQAAPFSKGAPKLDPKRRGRKPGGQYGACAHRTPPAHIDETIDVPRPDRCPCGGQVVGDEIDAQYQTEIPVQAIHRRFNLHFGRCTNCGRRVHGRHPLQTSQALGAAAAQLGPQAQAMVATLKDEVGVSYGDIEKILLRGWGISLTRGGAAQIVLRMGKRLDEPYRGILVVVRRSRVVYPDETGWKVAGLLQWMWVFVTRTVTGFVIRPSRGHDVPEQILGRDWSGTMVHDGWMPYDFFDKARHQQCLGHIQRRCKGLLETASRGAVRYPRAVLQLMKDAFALRDRRDAGVISPHGVSVACGRLESCLERLLQWRLSHPANRRLSRHLAAHCDEILVFLKRRGIEATSWPADQAIRGPVANRKVFGGNRDPAGARALERIGSVVATCVKRRINVVDYLVRVLCAAPHLRAHVACHLLGVPRPP